MQFSTDSPDSYLETEVLTATPQKLQLLMINGALRFAYQAQQLRADDQREEAWEKTSRCREIVTQILCSIKPDGSELLRTVSGIYLFLFQELTEINAQDAYQRLAGVIRVLEEERQTWEELCRQMPEAPERPEAHEREITSSEAEAMMREREEDSSSPRAGSSSSYGFEADYDFGSGGGLSFDA